jgi:ATP-dependent RNA helicase DDX3X
MADQLNMNGLNLGGDGPQSAPGARSYIPPHMRSRGGGGGGGGGDRGAAGLNNSAWAG